MSLISNGGTGGVGSGTVTNTGTLTANKLTMGTGGVDITSSGVDATNPLFNTLVAQPSTAVGALVGRVVLAGSEYGVEVQNKANNAHIAGIDGLGAIDGNLIRMNGSGSGVVTVQPAAAAGTWTLTLPTDDGNNNDVLTTNGSGVCSWAAGGGASTFDAIGSGTNTTAAMVNGTGSSLATSGSGTLTANAFSGVLPLANGGRTKLDSQFANNTLTGDSTDQVMFTYTLPASTIGAGEGIKIMARWNCVGSTSTAYKLTFGGTLMFTTTTTTANGMILMAMIFNQPGVTNAQTAMGKHITFNNIGGSGYADAAIDTTSPVVINWTFNVANTVTITTSRLWEVTIVH